MRAIKRYGKEGFTLVELMIVVAIIGVLAALAIYGVNRYLASAKTSEAKNTVGGISRAAYAAWERQHQASELLPEGGTSTSPTQGLCDSAAAGVPSTFADVQGKKYQPAAAANTDFEAGSDIAGWKCLRFTVNQPIYYQYNYKVNTGYVVFGVAPGTPPDPTAAGFEAAAIGDLDNDNTKSYFSRAGAIDGTTKMLRTSTTVFMADEFE